MVLFSLVLLVCFLLLLPIIKWSLQKRADLSNELILITGAAHGIGRNLTLILANFCKNIIVVDKNLGELKSLSNIVGKRSGVSLTCYPCNLRYAIQNLANEIRTKHGRVTILISNAGVVNGNYLLDVPTEKVEYVIRVNLLAPFYLIKEFLPGMLGRAYKETLTRIPPNLRVDGIPNDSSKCFRDAEPKGHLVFMSSLASQTIGTAVGDYCASKAGLSALVDSLRLELDALGMRDKIFVTDIRPYVVNTGMFEGFNSKLPILKMLDSEYVAREIVGAIQYQKRIVYIPRIIWFIPLIQRIFPYKFLVFLYKISGAFDGMNTFTQANKKQT